MVEHLRAKNPPVHPICSVCIANYNGADTIGACIDSVLGQDFDYEIEMIVHDDASTDNSVKVIQAAYPNVELLISQKNCGFCVSNNRMASAAKGEFILLLNNDAALFPDALRTLHEYSRKLPVPHILGLPQYDMETHELIDFGSLFDLWLTPFPNRDPRHRDVGVVTGGCMWMPKSLWDTLGGFPEEFDMVAEDIFICCYARLRGYPVEVIPSSGFRHWVGKHLGGGKIVSSRMQTTLRRRALSERNRTWTMVLCYPSKLLAAVLPLHLVALCAEGLLLTIVKRDSRIWREIYGNCLRTLWQKRRFLLKKRREIQSLRKVSLRRFLRSHHLMPHKLYMVLKHGLPVIQ